MAQRFNCECKYQLQLISIDMGGSVILYLFHFHPRFPCTFGEKYTASLREEGAVRSVHVMFAMCLWTLKRQLRREFHKIAFAWSSVVFTTHGTMVTLCGKATGQFQSATVIAWVSASWMNTLRASLQTGKSEQLPDPKCVLNGNHTNHWEWLVHLEVSWFEYEYGIQ